MSEKKKVYVETTVVSDATALPARDVFLYVANASGRSVRMTVDSVCDQICKRPRSDTKGA